MREPQWTEPNSKISGAVNCKVNLDLFIVSASGTILASGTNNNINGNARMKNAACTKVAAQRTRRASRIR